MDVTSKALCGMGFGLGCSLNGGYYKSTFSLKFRGCSYIMQSQTWGEGRVFLIYYNITWGGGGIPILKLLFRGFSSFMYWDLTCFTANTHFVAN